MKRLFKNLLFVPLAIGVCLSVTAAEKEALETGVRGIATRAPKGMKIDGDLSEFKNAFSTPMEYFNADLKNRPAQFFYMWDEEAFYAGLRTLDTKPANHAPDDRLWEGDGVEWYFDTRRDANFRGIDWGKGAVHCYWTGLKGTNVQPRFCLRPGYLDAIPKTGVEVGARRTAYGMEVEFKLPWANFPNFKAALNQVIALDAELCYSDGGPRVFRSFIYGSPLSVTQPASQAKIQLVDKLKPEHFAQTAAVMFPVRADVEWAQKAKGMAIGYMALPPNGMDLVDRVAFRLVDLQGKPIADIPGEIQTISAEGNFARATARWRIDQAAPGQYHLLGLVYGKSGKEIARVAPRMVSVNMNPGY